MTQGDPRESSGRFAALGPVTTEGPRWQRRASLLSELIGAFAEATTDYQPLIDAIAHKVADVVGDFCGVILLSEEGDRLSLAASHARDPEMLAHVRGLYQGAAIIKVPIHQRILDTGEPYFAPRVNREAIRNEGSDQTIAFTDRVAIHSLVMVALRAGHRTLGELALVRYSPEQPAFDDHDRDLAQLIADNAAVAIENARALRHRQHELLLAKESAECANHELEAFSYSVAHDLRAPLRAIDWFTTALETEHAARLDEDGRHCLGRVRCASSRMTHLVDDLLTLARVAHGTLQRERIDLTDIARKILFDLCARSPGRTVEAMVPDGLRAIADPGLLQVLLENLLSNAWKFTGQRPVAAIEVGARVDGGYTVFFVRDNGAGFDMKDADKLFRPFQRLHASAEFEGSGIGLATVQRIVGRHGGEVWVESQVDRGTTVYFTVSE